MRLPEYAGRALVIILVMGVLVGAPLVACNLSGCPPAGGDGGAYDHEHQLLLKIGKFQSKDAGMRAAIKRLATATQSCPETNTYRIMWIGPSDENQSEMECADCARALLYCGKESAKWLGYEHDFLSGASSRTYLVDRAAIEAVAAKDGTLDDFDQYDQSPPSTRNDGR